MALPAPSPTAKGLDNFTRAGYLTTMVPWSQVQQTVRNGKLHSIVFLVVMASGLFLRLAYLAEVRHEPDFRLPGIDAKYHDYWARALVSGDWTPPEGKPDPEIQRHPYFRPPGYPFFLALLYRITHGSYLWSRALQMAMGLASAALAFGMGRRWFGLRMGMIWGTLTAFYWAFPYYESQYLEPPLLVLLGLLAWAAAGFWTERFRAGPMLAAGALWGLYALVRPNVLPWIPVFAAWIWWVARRRRQPARTAWSGILALGLGVACAIAPATWRNYRTTGERVLISTNGGINLLIGNNAQAQGTVQSDIAGYGFFGTSFDYPVLIQALAQKIGAPVSHAQASRIFARDAWKSIRAEPSRILRLMGLKTLLFWGPMEVGNNKEDDVERAQSRVLRWIPGSFSAVLALFLVGAGLAAWRGVHRKRGGISAVENGRAEELGAGFLLFIAVFFASYLPFFVAGRYRVPLVPFMLPFGAGLLAAAWDWFRQRNWRALLVAAWAVAGTYAVVGRNYTSLRPDAARWHFDRAVALAAQGQTLDAEAEYERVLQIHPDYSLAHFNLGSLLANQGRRAEAKPHFEEAVRLYPGYLPAQLNLGLVCFELGEKDRALQVLQSYLEQVPDHPAANYFVGQILAARRQPRAARDRFAAALRADPDNPDALNSLAWLLATTPDDAVRNGAEAVRLAQRACELTGQRHPAYLDTLAAAQAEAGRFAEAADLARQAGELLPANAPAGVRAGIHAREERYRQGQPWREPD